MKRRLALAAVIAVVLGLGACASPAYYAQAIGGQFAVLRAARPLAEVQADGKVPEKVRERLVTAAELRDFASSALALPDNGSYRRYADLHRPYVVWNVFAAEPLSISLKQWCFPIAGCVGYRGYFDVKDAEAYADGLRAEGYDVYVGGIPAYSTLGWFDDPILSTFIHYPEVELARLIFHELAHQVAYARGDTEFNESFATAVEEAGIERWLARRGDPAQRAAFAAAQARRSDFYDLVLRYRKRLGDLYAGQSGEADKLRYKAQILAELQAEYRALRDGKWGGFAGYDRWFAQDINNATLASIGLYRDKVPAFRALLDAHGGELPAFYAEVKKLARESRQKREERLTAVLEGGRLEGDRVF